MEDGSGRDTYLLSRKLQSNLMSPPPLLQIYKLSLLHPYTTQPHPPRPTTKLQTSLLSPPPRSEAMMEERKGRWRTSTREAKLRPRLHIVDVAVILGQCDCSRPRARGLTSFRCWSPGVPVVQVCHMLDAASHPAPRPFACPDRRRPPSHATRADHPRRRRELPPWLSER